MPEGGRPIDSDVDDRVAAVVANWRPRFIANGIDALDLERTLIGISTWEEWGRRWTEAGERYEMLGDKAQADGHAITAATHLTRAALTYQFAQFVLTDDPKQRVSIHKHQCAVYRRAAPLLRPPASALSIPAGDVDVPAYLRTPDATRPLPLVVLVPGLESTKEQFTTFEPFFLERGLATLAIEGPGQGECRYQAPWRDAAWLDAFARVLAFARAHAAVDAERIALLGTSFGGYLALEAASLHDVVACVDIAGPFDLSDFDSLQEVTRESFAEFAGAATRAEAAEAARRVSLEGRLANMRARVLVVHGGRDTIIPATNAERIAAELGGAAELWLLPDGNHSCNNLHTTVRPAIADWVADALGAEAG